MESSISEYQNAMVLQRALTQLANNQPLTVSLYHEKNKKSPLGLFDKPSSLNTVVLEIKISICELWEDTNIQTVACYKTKAIVLNVGSLILLPFPKKDF